MKRYQRILVCIDRSERDHRMLAYVGSISRAAETKQVHLLHVEPESAAPPPEVEAGLTPPAPAPTNAELQQLAADHLAGHGGEEIVAAVVTGTPLLEILRYALEKEIDLIVIGRRPGGGKHAAHEAVLARRVCRKATCSVLVLPEDAVAKAQRIVVPARDSECSAGAMDVACDIAATTGGTICCLNVFRVESGYHSVGTTLEEHTAVMHKWAEKECEQLVQRVDTRGVTITIRCEPDLYGEPVPIILDQIEAESADLVVIGARGRTGAAGVLLGAVTEQLIRQSTVPLLAVKKKGECIGILQALLTLAGAG